jgi:excisionase family DNA binding protein
MNLRTFTVAQVSEITGFPATRIYRMVKAGELRYIKGGSTNQVIRIFENSLTEWFDRHAQGGRASATRARVNGDDALPPVDHPAFS